MTSDLDLHGNLDELVVVETARLAWQPTEDEGIFKKSFELIRAANNGREACLYKYQPGTRLGDRLFEGRIEILVIEGHLSMNGTDHGAGSYLRVPPGVKVDLESNEGCVFFFRYRAGVGNEKSHLELDTNDRSQWQTWGGRGNQRIPLEDPAEPNVGAWLGYMFPEHQSPEHDHPGGEEVLILYGELDDHTVTCGGGTWVRYPIGYVHSPVAQEAGVLMLVREGDVRAVSEESCLRSV
jgi:anti-sigma factor ChrR (cupin superfamily)